MALPICLARGGSLLATNPARVSESHDSIVTCLGDAEPAIAIALHEAETSLAVVL
jgi:hypothetical protein